jgi:protein SCO1/2
MTTKRITVLLMLVVAAMVALARARRGGAEEAATRTYEVAGVVTAAPADGRLIVSHQDIPGYMPAMTMPFAVAPEAMPALTPGDRVRFTLRVAAEWSRAEGFVKTGRDEAVASALRAPAPGSRARLKPGDPLPAFSLLTHENRAFTSDDFRDRLTVVTFIFTRCPVPEYCPLLSRRFQQLQRTLDGDRGFARVRLVSVTLDPEFDRPPVLAAYAEAMKARPDRWQFVTGETGEITRIAEAFSVHAERNGVLLEHTLATALIDGDARVVEIWRGNGWKLDEIVERLRRETAAGEVR